MTTVVDGLRVEVGLGSTPATPLASIAWTDVTSDVLLPRTVTFNRGRGSQESGATPGRLTLTLNNGQASGKSVGRWTRGGSNCTAGWGLRVPIRVLYSAQINGSFESNAAGWGALSACTVARSTAQAYSGSASLALTATSAATMSAISSQGVNGTPVRASQAYTARARIRATAASRTGYVSVSWYNAAGTVISTSAGTPAALTSGAWVEVTTAVTAPSTAAYAALVVYVATPAVSEVAYVDLVALDLGLWLGYVDAARPAWENGVRPIVEVSATDRLGRFQRRNVPRLARAEIEAAEPVLYYPLSDAAGTAHPGEMVSGTDALSLVQYGTTPVDGAAWWLGEAEVASGDATCASFVAGTTTGEGFAWVAYPKALAAGTDWTIVATLRPSTVGFATMAPVVLDRKDGAGASVELEVTTDYPDGFSAHVTLPNGYAYTLVEATGVEAVPDEWVHVAIVLTATSCRIYVNGVEAGANTSLSHASWQPNRIRIGGESTDGPFGHFTGAISDVAVFASALSSDTVADLAAAAGLTGADTPTERFGRLCRLSGLGAGEYATTSSSLTVPPGNSSPSMGPQPTDGSPFLDAVQQCADVERGVVYVDGAGVLTLQRGAFRFNQHAALTLTPKDVDPGTSIDDDLDRLVNDVTVRRPGGAEQRVVNQASVDAYDTHNETLEIAAADDTQALAVAAWKVADEGTPQPRVDSVAVDAVAKAATVAASSLLTVPQSGRVQLTPMPTPESHSSTVDLLADGFTDRVTESSWLRTMTTSSATNYSNVWLWDTATEKFDTGGVLY